MKVSQLIALLDSMPPDARVFHLWDGIPRTEIQHVWVAVNGSVVTADHGEICYEPEWRPVSAPTDVYHWHTPDPYLTEGPINLKSGMSEDE